MSSRRRFLGGLCAGLAAGWLGTVRSQARRPLVSVYMSPGCGCCGEWVKHVRRHGFPVQAQLVDDVAAAKRRLGVPQALWSCHTALVDGYAIEGHVPAADIERLLAERPQVSGLAVPGMPVGAPGMEQGAAQPYVTLAFGAGGNRLFAPH
jgi:hypothetical protein